MKIIVCGGDGFCGWPTSLHLASLGHEVLIVDNLSRRNIDHQLSSGSLTSISSISERVDAANEYFPGLLRFENIDIALEFERIKALLDAEKPDAIVHFAEQRAAPYSMIGDKERRYTVDNNITGTHNLCSAIVETDPQIHLIHLGTMGVYGYSKELGSIPEGYLNVKINETGADASILYPANPGSIYHMSKCLDQLIFQFYSKNWQLKITDLHQGIVWGINTVETSLDPRLINRFDYDGIYGTVLNRFISQSTNGVPLTVYGEGGQKRAFIHISDTARCIALAIENPPKTNDRVRIFNQVAEVKSVAELARLVSDLFKSEVQFIPNPRKELASNDLDVSNVGLRALGFEPVKLDESLIRDVKIVSELTKKRFNEVNVINSPTW